MNEPARRPEPPVEHGERENHRVRVGRERRERMRAQLLQSILYVCSTESARGPAVINDVVKHAGVARGTFYKYFDSLEQGVLELGSQLAHEMTAGIMSVYDVLEDPVLRTATGFQMFLIRSVLEPQWGAFIAGIGILSTDNLLTRSIRDDVDRGVETGDYCVPSTDIATDLLLGAKIEAIRRLIKDNGPTGYIGSMTSMVLRSFGISQTKADKSVLRAFDRLCLEAPNKIAWWRPLDRARIMGC